ncbi:MAG: hypothetical protein KDD69_14290 [Bdellovibrionales bacterium]|nr:hypothetical protein [Bdellovibrionales bacterium]
MVWLILVCVIYLSGIGAIFMMVGKKTIAIDRQLRINLETVKEEEQTKLGVLGDLAEMTLGLVTPTRIQELEAKRGEAEESIRAEKGRLTITEAELEAVDTRLRELEELKRELEVSNMDAVKELEMLRAQERDIAAKNDALRNQINASVEQIEFLLEQLANSAEAVERLSAAKNELLDIEKQSSYYEEQIAAINMQYMNLKKAYDALDIEYAQLYEKQQLSSQGDG